MLAKKMAVFLIAALGIAACSKNADETTRMTTQTDTKRVGSTSESTTKTTVDTAEGDLTTVTKSYVGTVTKYTPGESIELMTGDSDTHAFSLDGKEMVVAIDPRTTVGSKVQLVEEKPEKGAHRIVVTIAPAA
jgi:ABC-type glycerol-3-phosphate transport system substrate-binding protein